MYFKRSGNFKALPENKKAGKLTNYSDYSLPWCKRLHSVKSLLKFSTKDIIRHLSNILVPTNQ